MLNFTLYLAFSSFLQLCNVFITTYSPCATQNKATTQYKFSQVQFCVHLRGISDTNLSLLIYSLVLNSDNSYRLRLFVIYVSICNMYVHVRAYYIISVIICDDMYSFLTLQCVKCISQCFGLYENG
jgi:hypothetical protein